MMSWPGITVLYRAAMHLTIPALVVAFAGCVEPHRRAEEAAQQRWDAMRARMKLRLARSHFRAGHVEESLEHLTEAMRLKHDAPGSATLLAKIQMARGEMAAARDTLNTISISDESRAEAAYLRGVLEERAGRREHAFDAYRSALDAEPQSLDYVVATAEMMLALGHADVAVSWLDRLEEAHGHAATYHALRGQALRLAGRFVEAAAAYETARDLGNDEASILEAQGFCLFWAERYKAASVIFEKLDALDKDVPGLSWQLAHARCMLELGWEDDAVQRLAVISKSFPDSARVWSLMALATWKQGASRQAYEYAQRAAKLESESVEAHLMAATFAYRMGLDAAAGEIVQDVLKAEPHNPLALRLRVRLAQRDSRDSIRQDPTTGSQAASFPAPPASDD